MSRFMQSSLLSKFGAVCLGAGLALATVSAGFAADVKMSGGGVWKGDAGAKVRVVYLLNGRETTLEGEVSKIDATIKLVKVKVAEGGKTSERTIFWADIKRMETLGADAKTPAGAPATKPAGGTDGKSGSGGGTAATPAGDKNGAKKTVFIMPWEGTVGIGARHDEIEKIGKEADKIGPGQIIILEVISPGGLVIEGDKIDETLVALKQRHRVIAWVKEAISAAAFTSLHCDEIYFQRVGTLGAITMFAGTKAAEGAELTAWLKKVGDVCELGGRSRWIGEAMVTNPPLLSYDKDEDGNVTWYNTLQGKYKLSDAEQNLTLNADNALHCKFSDGTADNVDELLALLHLDKDQVVISQVGYKIFKDWHTLLDTCMEQKPKIIRDVSNPSGSDAVAQISGRIKAIKQLLEWYDKCLPCLMYEQPQVPPKEELEKMLKDLKKQLAEAQKEKREGNG